MMLKKLALAISVLTAAAVQDMYGGIYGGLGGFESGVIYNDLSSLNSKLTANGYPSLSSYNFIMGGSGGGYLNNVFIGGDGFGNPGQSIDNGKDVAQFYSGMGFFNVGYAVFHNRYFIVTPKLGIGGGGGSLTITPSAMTNNDFGNILSNPANMTQVYYGSAAINIELSTVVRMGLVNLGVNTGYIYSGSPQWESASGINSQSLVNEPQINPSSVYLTLGVYFGHIFDSLSEYKQFQMNMIAKMTNAMDYSIFGDDSQGGVNTPGTVNSGMSNQNISAGLKDQARGVLTNTGN